MLRHLFTKSSDRRAAAELYNSAVDQARLPAFYGISRVPDTVDGRFDMIALHVFLLLYHLKDGAGKTGEISQALFDAMFADMDRSLREMGAGDLGVGRRVKAMATAFYGRVAAYEKGLSDGTGALEEAVLRNVFRGDQSKEDAAALIADYIREQVGTLRQQPLEALRNGRVAFSRPLVAD